MPGVAGILLNRTDYDSGNDAAGSGTDPATNGGRILDVVEGAEVGITLFLGEADATVANDAETLDMNVEVSVDGGSNWGRLATFRQITASELKSAAVSIDESAGDPTFRLAIVARTPKADAGESGVVQIRPNGTASSTNHWAPFMDVRDRGSIRDEWLDEALAT